MPTQRTQHDTTRVDPHATAAAERAADETLDRLTRAREDADTLEDDVAEQAWRQIERLSARLKAEAHTIVVTLEGGDGEQRDRVEASLLHCREQSTDGGRPR